MELKMKTQLLSISLLVNLLAPAIILGAAEQKNMLVSPQTGEVSPYVAQQLERAGVNPGSLHITDVNQCLQAFYRPGNDDYRDKPLQELHVPQSKDAQGILNAAYALRKDVIPEHRGEVDVILPLAVGPALQKRIALLQALKDYDYQVQNIFFVGDAQHTEVLMGALLSSALVTIDVPFSLILSNKEGELFEHCLQQIKKEDIVTGRALLVANPPVACRYTALSKEHFEEKGVAFLGCASIPEKDWYEDMKSFGYNKIEDQQERAQRYAWSELNFLAKDVNRAYNEWEKHKASEE